MRRYHRRDELPKPTFETARRRATIRLRADTLIANVLVAITKPCQGRGFNSKIQDSGRRHCMLNFTASPVSLRSVLLAA